MATGKIIKSAVEAMPPSDIVSFLWDTELKGFAVKRTPAGSKVFILEYKLGGRAGKTQRITIGKYGPITPDQARTVARRHLSDIAEGIDPAAAKAKAKRDRVELAFSRYAARYLAIDAPKRSYTFVESILRVHVIPVLKDTPLPAITKADIRSLIDNLPDEQISLRRNVFAVVSALFSTAANKDHIPVSPTLGMKPPPKAESRDRVLSDSELILAWLAAGGMGYPFGTLYRLLIATGQRREEVAALDWSELDAASATWTLPAARAKNGVASLIPLNALAVAELDTIAALHRAKKWPAKGLVLTTNGRTPISGYSKAKARLDASIGGIEGNEVEPWRVHDLRRTLATGLQRLGVRFEVTEAVLNHVSGAKSGVAGVYQRHDWKEEKRAALNAWGWHVESLLNPADQSNVVLMRTVNSSSG